MTLERREYEVVVVGSGAAGSAAAQTAAHNGAKVLLISKDPMVCSDSKISEGIVTVQGVASKSDSPTELETNIRVQGDDIVDRDLTQAFSKDSASSYQWLRDHGLTPDINPNTGKPITVPVPMGGHNKVRSVLHKNGGLAYGHALWNGIMQEGNIDHIEDAWLLDLYVSSEGANGEPEIVGALIYHASAGRFISVKTPSVVLASGGLSTIYFPHTDTMKGNCGDAYAIAARAGAQLVDMEQVQFIPFAVTNSPTHMGLVLGEPVSVGPLGVIRDREGVLLQSDVMVHTRAECAAVIAKAVAEGRGTENGGCYLDMTKCAEGKSGEMFVQMISQRAEHLITLIRKIAGPKAARFEEPLEVAPSAHYHMGGVRVNERCEALINDDRVLRGLTAAGQAMGGLHGSNRLGSTSLAEGVIFGRRAGHSAVTHSLSRTNLAWSDLAAEEKRLLEFYKNKLGRKIVEGNQAYPIHTIRSLQKSCWQGVGPARTEQGIQQVIEDVSELELSLEQTTIAAEMNWNQSFIDYVEGRSMLHCARFVAESALLRKTSVGAHVRLDESSFSAEPKPYSIAVKFSQRQSAGWVTKLNKLPRQRSSALERFKINANQAVRGKVIKLLSKLPLSVRDPILVKVYSKLNGEAV